MIQTTTKSLTTTLDLQFRISRIADAIFFFTLFSTWSIWALKFIREFMKIPRCFTASTQFISWFWTASSFWSRRGDFKFLLCTIKRKALTINLLVTSRFLAYKILCCIFYVFYVKFFESYLSDRKQYVTIDSKTSSTLTCRSQGVPQGSILSPTLFLLYINDLANAISHCVISFYADDSHISKSHSSIQVINSSLNDDLNSTQSWCCTNRIAINPPKSTSTLFGSSQKLSQIDINTEFLPVINGDAIKVVDEFPLLGFILDHHLNFKAHVCHVVSKLNSGLFFLRKANELNLPRHSRFLIYFSLMHSHIMYGLCIYSSCTDQTLFQQIQIKRKAAIRLIFGTDPLAHTAPLFKVAEWFSLSELADLSLFNHICLSLSIHSPSYFTDLFQETSHSHSTRFKSSNGFAIPTACRSFQQRTVLNRAIKTWNNHLSVRSAILSSPLNNLQLMKSHARKAFQEFIHTT